MIFDLLMLFYPRSLLFSLFKALIDVFISIEAFALLYSRCFFYRLIRIISLKVSDLELERLLILVAYY
jgi:hypothetical protein